jgi:hypothetical protein
MTTLSFVVNQLSKQIIPAAQAVDKARVIYDWLVKNIDYDHDRCKAINNRIEDGTPFHPEITLRRGKGVCSDMALLYIALANDLGISAHYADVSVDCKGKNVCHACAALENSLGHQLIDPAYKRFDAGHKRYMIINPKMKFEDNTPFVVRKKRHLIKTAAAVIAGFCSVAAFAPSVFGQYQPKKQITCLETDTGARFVSQNGIFRVSYDKEIGGTVKEYLFCIEASKGELDDRQILDNLLAADKDNDGTITAQEAKDALSSAREAYRKKN